MFDTHCHLNFSRFKKNVDEVIQRAKDVGVDSIVIPGTDIPTSQKALEIVGRHKGLYAAVGVHPHHVYEYKKSPKLETGNLKLGTSNALNIDDRERQTFQKQEQIEQDIHLQIEQDLVGLEGMLQHSKAVAVGEIGMDRHVYEDTKYADYNVDELFITLQRELFQRQILLAIKYKKSVIIHNREAKADVLGVLTEIWSNDLAGHAVFHCCEPDVELLQFAKDHSMFVGIDGDVTYMPEKQEFIKKVPVEMLVVETDSPFLLPEPLKSQKLYPNEPKTIPLIVEFIAKLRGESAEMVAKVTEENAQRLFSLPVNPLAR